MKTVPQNPTILHEHMRGVKENDTSMYPADYFAIYARTLSEYVHEWISWNMRAAAKDSNPNAEVVAGPEPAMPEQFLTFALLVRANLPEHVSATHALVCRRVTMFALLYVARNVPHAR